MATIKRYRYIIDNDIKYFSNKIYPQLKVYKGNSSNQAELISNNFEVEEISTDIDFTKTTFTEAEVIAAIKCNAVSNFKVGDILTISNSYCSQWVVIGKDHDGTTGTIDIMATTQVAIASYPLVNPVDYSYYRFNKMIILSACKTMNFKVTKRPSSSSEYYTEKAKIISCTELNYSEFQNSTMATDEGEPYKYFPRAAYNTAIAKRWVPAGSRGSSEYYWVRSRYLWNQDPNSYSYTINADGTGWNYLKKYNNKSYGIVPIVRLGSMINE